MDADHVAGFGHFANPFGVGLEPPVHVHCIHIRPIVRRDDMSSLFARKVHSYIHALKIVNQSAMREAHRTTVE
jgi:hypothetical protein